jgi:sugar-specific transcriptional regulator TrmB
MTTNLIISSLLELGLHIFEAKLYDTILHNPKVRVTELANKNNCSRTKIYSSLEILKKTELLDFNRDYAKEIKLEPPTKILTLLRHKQNETSRKINELNVFLPELIVDSKQKINLQNYTGVYEFTNLINKVLDEAKDEILFWGNMDGFYELLGWDYLDQFGYFRRQKNIFLRMLVFKTFGTKKFQIKDSNEMRETKFLQDEFHTDGVIWIYNNKIIQWNLVELQAFEIQDSIMTNFMRQMFEMNWAK